MKLYFTLKIWTIFDPLRINSNITHEEYSQEVQWLHGDEITPHWLCYLSLNSTGRVQN